MSARTPKPSPERSSAEPASGVAKASRRGPFTASSCLELLMNRAVDHLSADDLQWIAQEGLSHAQGLARDAKAVAVGVACLVAHDAGLGKGSGAGNFQDGDGVFTLLVHLGETFDHVAGLIALSTAASDQAAVRAGNGQAREQ